MKKASGLRSNRLETTYRPGMQEASGRHAFKADNVAPSPAETRPRIAFWAAKPAHLNHTPVSCWETVWSFSAVALSRACGMIRAGAGGPRNSEKPLGPQYPPPLACGEVAANSVGRAPLSAE
jgi:hypothetical protein